VSRTFDPREPVNRIISPIAAPRQLPQISSPRILTALEDVQARLDELERIEDHNAQKLKRLEAKRRRKDERIVRRRAMEDEKLRSIHDARARKDERVRSRRQREDEAFRGADKQLGVEELVSLYFSTVTPNIRLICVSGLETAPQKSQARTPHRRGAPRSRKRECRLHVASNATIPWRATTSEATPKRSSWTE
jgi:hypothetical protein